MLVYIYIYIVKEGTFHGSKKKKKVIGKGYKVTKRRKNILHKKRDPINTNNNCKGGEPNQLDFRD